MNALFALFFKLALAGAALIFALSLLLALLVVLILTSLWSLLHGRKPKVTVLWTRYRDLTRGMRQGGPWSAARRQAGRGPASNRDSETDIVDVQVKEVHESVQRLPPRD